MYIYFDLSILQIYVPIYVHIYKGLKVTRAPK